MNQGRLSQFLLALVGMFLALDCVGDEIKWTEEVQLHDGRIVQLKRKTEIGATGFPVQRRGFDRFHEFCYVPMGMHWKMRASWKPDIFEVIDGRPYLHVPLGDCFECQIHDYPDSNALAFVWEKGGWKRIRYEDFPTHLRWNLLQNERGANGKNDATGLVTLTRKQSRDYGLLQNQKYKRWTRISEDKDHPRCSKCKEQGRGQTDKTSDVFVQPRQSECNW